MVNKEMRNILASHPYYISYIMTEVREFSERASKPDLKKSISDSRNSLI